MNCLHEGLCVENGVEHELVICNIMEGANKTPEFLKMNPMHCIPTMVSVHPMRANPSRLPPFAVVKVASSLIASWQWYREWLSVGI